MEFTINICNFFVDSPNPGIVLQLTRILMDHAVQLMGIVDASVMLLVEADGGKVDYWTRDRGRSDM
jgi:hypothetical protein